ncbi:curli-like amyloid fiber formation chaperone CsgH [Rhizobium tumorigenes]|uniref:curli-like amyloid fiber formation chaperone CsgH n=1 Tax=Rhizobium tumorigenes TaxID=2041385 RepID=UPI00241D377D|nr:curli-like amyloid fiber formation chaperone CsgH [Rhizobium tumorigenes]WFS04328.1 curli-like amyloid fiber formation chaperone CsgH [Rhizobium tumorigenes]
MIHRVKHPYRLMAIFTLLLLPVGAFAAMTAKQSGDAQICEIKATPAGGMVRLDAFAHADEHLYGTYSFQVEKSGGSGRSTTSQSGDFDARAGKAELLSSVTLDSRGDTYKVMLDIMSGTRSFRCTQQIGSD